MADNKLKFLDIVGLTQLVSEIKTRINAAVTTATNKTLINAVEFDNAGGKITFKQGTDNSNVKDVTLDFATTDKNGLMTKEQVTELGRLNTDKLDKVALRIDGTDHASLFTTTTVNGKQVAVIDYTTKLSSLTDAQKIQAPTAEAVATALGTKVSNEAYTAKVDELDKAIKANAANIEKKLDTDTYTSEKAALEQSITDGLALKLDSSTYTADKQEQSLKDQNQDALINKHEAFLYTGEALNVYTKTEVNTAIANAKAAIVGGDDNAQLQETYKTLIEISNWIESNDGADDAAGLTKDVATLKNTTAGHTTSIEGLQTSVETIVGKDGKSGLIGELDTRLDTAETDIENLEKELDTADTGVKARLTALETELNTAKTGVKARLTTAENEIDQLQADYEDVKDALDTINGTNSGLALKADKTDAVGSVDDLVWNSTTNSYDLVFKSVAGTQIDKVSFQVFTADDITALFA